jgi:hypothetical protein
MLIEFVKDFNGTFVIGCANRLFTVGAVEIQHGKLCLSPGLTTAQELGFKSNDSFSIFFKLARSSVKFFISQILLLFFV